MRLAVVLVVAMALAALPARAQTGADVRASAGVDGWIERGEPFVVGVDIDAEILIDGVVETSMGGIEITTAVQVPAGTSKRYEIQMPPATGQRITVTLFDGSDTELADVDVSTRIPTDEVLVGIAPALDPAPIDRLTSPVVGRPIVALNVDPEASGLGLFDHLVVPGRDVGAEVLAWVESGGTLITDDPATVEALPLASSDGVTWLAVGDGLVLVVDDLSAPELYADLLLAGEMGAERVDPWQDPDRALTEAASNSGRSGIPDLPWLLAAIAGYAVVVVPLNFLVLHRMGKRDLAWITIPAISLLALGGFWLIGTQRLDEVSLSHASVVIGGDHPVSRSAVVLAVGSAGAFELDFADGAVVYPGSVVDRFDELGRPVSLADAEITGSTARVRLEQLGFAGVSTIGAVAPDLPAIGFDDGTVIIENTTQHEFWAWGMSDGSFVSARRDPLAPGTSSSIDPSGAVGGARGLESGFGMNVGDAVVDQLQLWNDDRGWQVISPIGRAAQFGMGEIPQLFWFGFTEGLDPQVTLDGAGVDPVGTTLVVVPIRLGEAREGVERGTLIGVGDGFVESGGGPGEVFVSSDEMWLRFELPTDATATEIAFFDQFGMRPGSFEIWAWESSAFEPVAIGDRVDPRFVDPAGRIVMRVSSGGAEGAAGEGFVEIPMSPRSVTIGWERP